MKGWNNYQSRIVLRRLFLSQTNSKIHLQPAINSIPFHNTSVYRIRLKFSSLHSISLALNQRVCSIGGTSHSRSFISRTARLTAARRLSPSNVVPLRRTSQSTSPSHASRSVHSAACTASCASTLLQRYIITQQFDTTLQQR